MAGDRPYYDELNRLYQAVLGRAIDHSGYFSYATMLERGEKSLAEIEQILRDSDEYRNRNG
jgi:hypothetical protein